MDITICYLYYDIMNLYGENGNFKVLCRHLTDAGFTVKAVYKTINEEKIFSEYNMIYMGSGTEANQKIALEDLIKNKDELCEFLNNPSKLGIFTGNSFEILGEKITDSADKVYQGIGAFEFETKEYGNKRYNKDTLCSCKLINSKVVGYVNKASEIFGIKTPLFKVLLGCGNSEKDEYEGIYTDSVIGTHLIGPIFARNPEFIKLIITLTSGKNDFIPQLSDEYYNEEKAYKTVLKELEKLAD